MDRAFLLAMAASAALGAAAVPWSVRSRAAFRRTSMLAAACGCRGSRGSIAALAVRAARRLNVRRRGPMFVAVVSVGRFAALRDSLGYTISSRILEELAARVIRIVPSAVLGRVGRSTIEMSFRDRSVEAAEATLLHLASELEARLTVGDYVFELPVAIGFTRAQDGLVYDELIDRAESGISAARHERVPVQYAEASLAGQQGGRVDLDLVRDLPHAIDAGELSLYYQPKLNARTNDVTSVEALMRWDRPGSGFASTALFIQLAEDTGVIRQLTDWAIERALADQSILRERGLEIEVHVNISARLLSDADFAARVLESLQCSKGKIGFEITETAVISNPDAALTNLRAFQVAGITIAIDDYGSGLSSLAYLKELPAQELKIDQLFVRGLTSSHRDPLIIRSTIDLAHALEMEVTAEGVDDPMALSLLRVMGCDKLQGYQISQPLPLDALIDFLGDEAALQRVTNPTGSLDWPKAIG